MQFRIIRTVDGSATSIDHHRLSQDLRPGILCKVEPDGALTHMGLITIWDLVFFARTWAGWVNAKPSPEALHTLELIDRFLDDCDSVTVEELERAGAAAWAAARAAEAAAGAAWAAWAAWAAASYAAAGRAAEAASGAAAWAARAAVEAAAESAAGAARDAMFERQGQFILETLAGR